jgi:biopolymer transport protein ExbB
MLNWILLQMNVGGAAVDSAASASTQLPQAGTQTSMSLWGLIAKGGPVMLIIGLMSVALIFLFVERLLTINKASRINKNLIPGVKDMLANGNIDGARNLCKTNADPVSKMIEKGITRLGHPIQEIESAMETAGKVELNRVEKNMGYLSTIAAIAPMFGFVGTIFGVISIFYNISQTGDFGIQTISEGLYQKMVTSAAGLIVGILAFICHHLLHNKVEALISKMEEASMEFIDVISEPGK